MASVSISAVATGQTTATLSWSASGMPSGEFPIEWFITGSGSISPSTSSFSSGSASGTSYVTGLSASTSYSWVFTANGGLTPVSWSATSNTVTTSAPPTYPPSWSDNTLGGFQATVAYSDGVSATNMSYSGVYSVSSGSLPAGISLNSSTGAVTGTPTTAGSYSFTLQAANSYGSVSQAFSGTVAAAPTAGTWQVWTGSVWVHGPLKVWNGSAWVASSVKVWNGTAWVTSV